MEVRSHRRGLVALAASLAVHVCVVSVLLLEDASRPSSPRAPDSTPLTWFELTPAPPSPRGNGERVGVRGPPAPPRTRRPAPPASPPAPSVPDATPLDREDTPRLTTLLPSAPRLGELPVAPLGGTTLHPSDLPTAAEQLADEDARVSARVSGWARSDARRAFVQGGGLLDPAYGELGSALRAATDDVPRFIDTDSVKEVLGAFAQSWGAGAERYGKTGAPYAEPEGRWENGERPSAAADAALRGSPDAQAMVSFLSAGARLQEFADGRAGLELYALVELQQSPTGALESVTLVRPSGLQPFDAWVTGRAREVGLAFVRDAGARTRPLRSLWRFDGVITYRRKLTPGKLDGRAALGMALMTALSMLSGAGHVAVDPTNPAAPPRDLGPRFPGLLGRFDELTGEVDVVDLTNPAYDCRVTLLEAD